ncbi:MAG: hypothetical protein SCK28_14260 [Bacillota bacterium]|nr:hypothetical protein [Bacillota bacterium]
MTIGIICGLFNEYQMFISNISNTEQIIIDGVNYSTGKLNSKEIVISYPEPDKIEEAVAALKDNFSVKAIIFTGTGNTFVASLSQGNLMIISEAIDEDVFLAESTMIDGIFKIIEKLGEEFKLKTVVGKVLAPGHYLPDTDHIICIDEAGVTQAKAAVKLQIPFLMLRVLTKEQQYISFSEEEKRDIFTNIFWLIKGLVEMI